MKVKTDIIGVDLENTDSVKKCIISNFISNGLDKPIIKQSRIKDVEFRGMWVYHPYCTPHSRTVQKDVVIFGARKTYRREKESYTTDFISTYDLDSFESHLTITVHGCLIRRHDEN